MGKDVKRIVCARLMIQYFILIETRFLLNLYRIRPTQSNICIYICSKRMHVLCLNVAIVHTYITLANIMFSWFDKTCRFDFSKTMKCYFFDIFRLRFKKFNEHKNRSQQQRNKKPWTTTTNRGFSIQPSNRNEIKWE